VDNLTVGKTAEPSFEDGQHISDSIPATFLNVYSELESLIPSMSEYFYRTMLTDEEKKESIYGCPKSSKVCYNPSPINEAAPGSVKKAEAAFNSIQVALAHGTRPIDYFINRMLQCIMGNAAFMATQARLDNLHSGMSFTGKPEQLVESEVKPLMDSEKFDTQLAAIKPTKRARQQQDRLRIPPVGGFRGEPGAEVERTSNGFNRSPGGRAPLGVQTSLGKAHGQSMGPGNRGEGIPRTFQDIGIKQQGLRGDPTKSFCSSGPRGFDEESAASPKSDTYGAFSTENAPYALQEEAQPRGPPDPDGRGGGFNNEESHEEVENPIPGSYSNLFCIPKKTGELRPLPVPRTTIRSVTEPPYLHKNPLPSSELGTNPENQGSSILGRPDNSRGVDRSMLETHKACTFEANRAGIFDKHSQIQTDPLSENHTPWYDHRKPGHVLESSKDKDKRPTARSRETEKVRQDVAQRPSELYRKGTSDVSGAPTRKINAAPTVGAEETILVVERVMEIEGLPIRRNNTESNVLEGPLEEMEWSVVPAGNPRSRVIHRCERYGLGYRYWPQKLLWLMEKIIGYTPHQLQGAAYSSICLATERNRGSVSSDLLRKCDHPRISERLWEHCLKTNTRPQVTYVPSVLNSVDAPSRLTAQTEWSISSRTFYLLDKRYGKHEVDLFASAINKKDKTRCDTTGRVGRTRTAAHPGTLFHSDLVSEHANTIDLPTTNSTSNRGGPRPEKRKVPTHQEQGLDSNCVENQRSALKEKGVSNAAIELILNSQRSVRRRSTYYPIQQKYKDWHRTIYRNSAISVMSVLVIVAPKEKRKGRPIIRPCEISYHSDKLLCPVEAYR
ncbi:hypothetical protein AYI69_g8995, partial [Smittium culicis]